MMTLIFAAAVAAAQPATVPATPSAQPAPVMEMAGQPGHQQHGQMADMKGCCCEDMMAMMHGGHDAEHKDPHAGHEGHSGQ